MRCRVYFRKPFGVTRRIGGKRSVGAKKTFRSAAWFSKLDKDGFIHRSWVGRGLPPDVFDGRPIIGICNTWSELTPCNAHFRELAEHVKRGVWEAGGLPFEFPVTSTGETSLRPTAMLFRNLVEHGRRGVDPRQSDGWRRAALRL